MIVAGARHRRRLAVLAGALALAGLCALAGGGAGDAGAQSVRPNFIVVMTDDQGPGMRRALSQVQRLIGDQGVEFTNALASFPLCCPSRATLLTGQYAHNHGAQGNNPRSGGGYRALRDPERNLAAWLQASGYDTAFAGKWLNGLRTPRRAPPGWDEWWGLVGSGGEGLSSFYDYDVFETGGETAHYGTGASDYQTDALTREYARPFIDAHATDPDPFFLWIAYHPPHNGLGRNDPAGRRCSSGPPSSRRGEQSAIPAPRHASRFANARLPRPPSFNEANLADKPSLIRRAPRLRAAEVERIERDYRCGLASLLALDEAVEGIVEELRGSGQLERTVILFTADHGVLAGQHRIKRGKNRPYEEAIKVPLLVRGPGVGPGARVRAPVANTDTAATILDLAGATVPDELGRTLDGVSLAPQLAGEPAARDRVVLIEGRDNTARSSRGFKVRSYVGVRTRRYAYFEHRRAGFRSIGDGIAAPIGVGRTTDRELYDLRRDPYQLASRDRDPRYADARRTLAGAVAELERCAGDRCVLEAKIPAPRR
jgi:arylsulfatase A-like enzyme